jgi:hypothetical protein
MEEKGIMVEEILAVENLGFVAMWLTVTCSTIAKCGDGGVCMETFRVIVK